MFDEASHFAASEKLGECSMIFVETPTAVLQLHFQIAVAVA